MSKEEIFNQVQEIFRDIFDDQELSISEVTTSADIEEWDSLEHINLIVAMEKIFNIKFNIEEVGELKNVGEMISLIERKLLK